MSIQLTRDQIEKLIDVYNHFNEIQTFTISLEEDSDMITVGFNLNDISSEHKPKDKFDKPFKPRVYK
jgi:hypothetical protein